MLLIKVVVRFDVFLQSVPSSETPTCKKKLFGETLKGGNEGGTDGIPKLTLSASILNSFATGGNEGGIDGYPKLTLSASILNSFGTGGNEGTLELNDSILTEDSTGTLVLNDSFLMNSQLVKKVGKD